MKSAQKILRIDCKDEKGLIYNITRVLYGHDLNIVSNQEFVDVNDHHFFMRTVYEDNSSTNGLVEKLESVLPENARIRLTRSRKKPIVVMATKEPHCLGELLIKNAYDEYPTDIVAVISNHCDLKPLVQSFNLPFHVVPNKNLSRKEHEHEISNLLKQYSPTYIVLAKYMRIFTPEFVARWQNSIINIHHSFLPAFVGARPYEQAYKRGVKIIGATAHFVTEDLDEGQIIAQDVIPVNHNYTAEDMANAGRDVEKIVLSKAVKMVLEEKVFIFKNRTVVL